MMLNSKRSLAVVAISGAVTLTGATTALVITAGPASADGSQSCSTDQNGTETCVSQTLAQAGQAHDHESSSAHMASHAKAGVTYLVSEHLVSKAKVQKAEHNGDCRWYKTIWNSGFINGSGKMGWKLDHHVYACWIDGRLIKEGGGESGLPCGNLEREVSSPPPVPERVKGKAEFVDHVTWKATAHATSTSTASVGISVTVHNADYSCQASASSTATSKGTGSASASAKARSKASALASARGKLVKLLSKINQQAKVNALASAKSSATANAEAKASCSPSTPPSPTPTPSQTPTITVSNVTSPQEVYNDGETYPNIHADVSSPNGDSITCVAEVVDPSDHTQPGFGSMVGTRSYTITSSGVDQLGPYTYQAPNDGTGSVVGQYDQIGVTCHDNSNSSVQDASGYSKPFEILAPPAPPQ